MNTLNKKAVYSLLCNRILLKYLDNKDRTKFSSTCKFIFQSCTRFRLSTYNVKSTYFERITKRKSIKSRENAYNDQIKYANTIITKYKPHLISLVWIRDEYFYILEHCYILEHFSYHFGYLRSLHLEKMRIPQKKFKNIIENLPYLCNLVLSQIGIALRKNDQNLVKIEFSVYLKKLKMVMCYQFNCDSEESISVESNYTSFSTINYNCLNMSNYYIKNIRSLLWSSTYRGEIAILNELLVNNQKLEKLQLYTNESYFDPFSIISDNRYLTKLILYNISYKALNENYIPKLPFIKSIEIVISDSDVKFANLLFQNCPNLEELYCFFPSRRNNGNTVCHIIKSNKNLKKLIISDNYLDELLSIPFPSSNIEYLEFRYPFLYTGSLKALENLKRLKSIKFHERSKPSMDYDLKNQLFSEGACWREIEYSNSIIYWKVL
jgi:hypothetical protein